MAGGADDNAPAGAKTRWLATFYLCIPVGYALGYIFGGLIAGPLGWRAAFLLEAAAMLPFLGFCALAPALDLRGATLTLFCTAAHACQRPRAFARTAAALLLWTFAVRARSAPAASSLLPTTHCPDAAAAGSTQREGVSSCAPICLGFWLLDLGLHAAAGSDAAAGGGALKAERGLRAAVRSFGADLAAVLRHPVFACAVAGITFYTGSLWARVRRCPAKSLHPQQAVRQALVFFVMAKRGSRPCACAQPRKLLAAPHSLSVGTNFFFERFLGIGVHRTQSATRALHGRVPATACARCPLASRPRAAGVIGAYAYLGPKAGRDTFRIPGEAADLMFGGVTVATGVAGTLLGGILLDRMGASLKHALLICAVGCGVGCGLEGLLSAQPRQAYLRRLSWLSAGDLACKATSCSLLFTKAGCARSCARCTALTASVQTRCVF